MTSLLGQYDVITSSYDGFTSQYDGVTSQYDGITRSYEVIEASMVSLVLCLPVRNGLVNKVEFLELISQKW